VTKSPNIHETLIRDESVRPGSPRAFGIVMAAAFALLALLSWWLAGHAWAWMAPIAITFCTVALLWPAALEPLNRVWFKIGILLNTVVNPVVMALIFYGAIWPTGLVMKMMGKKLLDLKREPDRDSYWIVRRPPGPAPDTMKDQF